jgi:hypothetical protein
MKVKAYEGFEGAVCEARLAWPGGRSGTATFGNPFAQPMRRVEAVCGEAEPKIGARRGLRVVELFAESGRVAG